MKPFKIEVCIGDDDRIRVLTASDMPIRLRRLFDLDATGDDRWEWEAYFDFLLVEEAVDDETISFKVSRKHHLIRIVGEYSAAWEENV